MNENLTRSGRQSRFIRTNNISFLHLARRAFLTTCKQRWVDRYFGPLVRGSAAQRTTDMIADQR